MKKIDERQQAEIEVSSEKPLQDRPFMYIGYADDSGSGCSESDDKNCPFLVLGGPIIEDEKYLLIETVLANSLQGVISEEEWEDFEFHASDMFHAKKSPFDRIGPDKCRDILQEVLTWVRQLEIPILFGAVNKPSLRIQIYQSADPIDMAFRLYLESLDDWFMMRIFQKESARGILIVDEFDTGVRKKLNKAFRQWRSKPTTEGSRRGLTHHLLDDIYYGDSKNSVGIQLADVCAYFISRHLAGKADSEGFYNIIKEQIYRPAIFE